jgi:hypothetical protein
MTTPTLPPLPAAVVACPATTQPPTLREAAADALRIFDWLARRSIYGDTDMATVHAALRAALAQPVPDAAVYAATSERASPDWHAGFRVGLDAGKACAAAAHPQPAPQPLTHGEKNLNKAAQTGAQP